MTDTPHGLRTPLSIFRTYLEVMQKDSNAALLDYQEMGVTLERSLIRLETLVADLLLLAKGEKEIQLESVDLHVLLEEVAQELESLAQAHQISLRLETADPVLVQADSELLARVTSNLIENGIRYNLPGGSVTVSTQREVDGVVVSIKDTGIGISPEEQSRILERFYRVDVSRSRHHDGSGLGLSITAHIVQLHGGYIQVENKPGTGSTFHAQRRGFTARPIREVTIRNRLIGYGVPFNSAFC